MMFLKPNCGFCASSKKKASLLVVAVFLAILALGFPTQFFTGEKQGKVKLDDTFTLPFHADDHAKVILVYLGYVGCQTICMPSLQEITQIYEKLPSKKEVVVYFIDISDDGSAAMEFAQSFNSDFKGYHLNKADTMKLMHNLRAYKSDSLSDNGEIYHTGYLYLLKKIDDKNVTLKDMYYTRPFDSDQIIQDITEELR